MTCVTVVGSINIDLTSYLECWPAIGETVTARQTVIALGGKGANQAVAVARLGGAVSFIGAVGCDGFGDQAAKSLKDETVDTYLSSLRDTATGLAFIDVGPDGQNMIRLSTGANGELKADDVASHAKVIGASKVVLLQNEIGITASLEAAGLARAAGALVLMDPAPAPVPVWDDATLSAFDVITPNAHEAGVLSGIVPQSLIEGQEVAKKLQERGMRGAIVTMGELGVAWAIDQSSGALPALKVNTIDTVAAGDCFNGAFAAAYSRGDCIEDSIAFALHAAALATTRQGAASSLPYLHEIQALQPKAS